MSLRTRYRAADLAALPFPPGRLSKQAFDTGEIELRHFAPQGVDNQVPHDRDELYFVISGTGSLRRNGESVAFAPGDAGALELGHQLVDAA